MGKSFSVIFAGVVVSRYEAMIRTSENIVLNTTALIIEFNVLAVSQFSLVIDYLFKLKSK